MAATAEAPPTDDRHNLVSFIVAAGVAGAALKHVETVLDEEFVESVDMLRACLPALNQLKIGPRTLLEQAFAAMSVPPVKATDPPSMRQSASLESINIFVKFKENEATIRFACEDLRAKVVKQLLPQINRLATQHVPGAYNISGLAIDGMRLDGTKLLQVQAVQPGSLLTAIVEEMSPVHAFACGKKFNPTPEAKPAPPPKAPPEPSAPITPPHQQGNQSTHKGQKRGPKDDNGQAKLDKRAKPPLWTVGASMLVGGNDLSSRMDKMAKKVKAAGGVPAADGKGCGIWCEPCRKLQPLPRAFELQNWDKHTSRRGHKEAACMLKACQSQPQVASEETSELKIGSAKWLEVRMSQWRELRSICLARKPE